jgi:HlyD family secretion protein
LLLAGAAAIAVALATGAWRIAAGPRVEALAVARSDLVQTVVASGRVESPRRVEVGAAVGGIVSAVPVAEGERVAAGQLLVALDDREARAAVEQARFALAQAEARLAQIRSTSLPVSTQAARQAEVNFDSAERQLARSRELYARGFIGQAALDEAQRSRDVAASQREAARLQREAQGEGGAEWLAAQAALRQARASLELAEARLGYTRIHAPVAGVLIARHVERGNAVPAGKTLLVLSPAGETQLVLQVDERNLPLLRVGQAALASADAYPQERFAARVAYINPAVDPLRGSVEVKLAVPDPPPYLLQDMTVSVDVEVARRLGVLAIPAEALRQGDWVMVARDGHAARQAVVVAARGETLVEIASGLREGELVILPGGAAAEGRAVRAVAAAARNGRRAS